MHRRADTVDPIAGPNLSDRCRFQQYFNQEAMPCLAFQSLPFVAATSYGKPLGTHVACAHLQVGESARNQFYPRCALGDDRNRERWVAGVGLGGIEVVRALMAEFESIASTYRERLVTAKARVIAEASPRTGPAREVLAALVAEFSSEVAAFIRLHAAAVAETGMSSASLNATLVRALDAWQASARLDLPSIDEHWIGRADPEITLEGAESITVPGLSISTSLEPSEVRLTGQIDESNLSVLTASLGDAVYAHAPVTVDLSGVTFCSVGGLRQLAMGAARGELLLAGVPTHLSRALAAAGLASEGAGS